MLTLLLALAFADTPVPPPLPPSLTPPSTQPRPSAPAPGTVRYTIDGSTMEDLTPAQVAARVHDRPDARHLVWTAGLPGWTAPRDYPPVAAELAALPPARVKYSVDGTVQELTPDEIAARMEADPTAPHRVWRRGLPDWVPARMLPEVAAAVSTRAATHPGEAPAPKLKYTVDGTVLDLTAADIAARIDADPGASHLAWKKGMAGWLPASQLAEVSEALTALDAQAAQVAEKAAPRVASAGVYATASTRSPTAISPAAPPASGARAPAAVEVDPAAAIRAHLSKLDTGASPVAEPPPLTPSSAAGEGGVSYEPPPLPGVETVILIEEIPPELVEETLRREGLK